MRVDVSTHGGIRISNPRRESTLALSGCATNMAMVHPKGRILQYMNRIEVQARDEYATKYAKMYPKGVSFSGSNCALVYLVDAAGVRSTTDNFYDVYAENIADCKSVFLWNRSLCIYYFPCFQPFFFDPMTLYTHRIPSGTMTSVQSNFMRSSISGPKMDFTFGKSTKQLR